MLTDIRLHDLLEPGARALGFDILAVERSGRGRSTVLRVYIDGPDGVTVDDCAKVSRQLSAILDVEDPIPDHYTLEVSSPGLDRPLSKREHFEAVVGERVKLKTHNLVEGRRRFDGLLQAVDGDSVTVDVDGEVYRLAFSDIAKARLAPDYDELRREL
jgi:ribosome maturation factor RimP